MYKTSCSLLVAVLTVLVLALSGCTPIMPASQPMMEGAAQPLPPLPTPEPGKLTVMDVRARPAPLEGGNGATFLTVLNGLDIPVRLLSVQGDVAAVVELHETTNDNGVMKMEPHPEGFEIPAGGVLQLQPGGKHIMLLGLVKPLQAGDSFDLTLNFEGSDAVTVTVPVLEMGAGMMPSGEMPAATAAPQS